MNATIEARQWRITGQVQGVGFRPFVYRLAQRFGLAGWVRNLTGDVEIVAQGDVAALAGFGNALVTEAPPLARVVIAECRTLAPQPCDGFAIRESGRGTEAHAQIPVDGFVCNDCLRELSDPNDRRYRYPFINCTQCGPRYTLIEALPYDRASTSMAGFVLCARCRAEYENPADRRFHAEPLACPDCGPRLEFVGADSNRIENNHDALAATVDALRRGQIVAVKGIGGYHLLCDAKDDAVVARLRARKHRPHKPLAVMFPPAGNDGLDAVRAMTTLTEAEATSLRDPARPIVLLGKRKPYGLSEHIAPGVGEVGVMLPYSPLHHLLLQDYGAPLVATSGNLHGEPVLTDNQEAGARLAGVADAFLHHNRPIVRPADDSVVRAIHGRTRPMRLGRGLAPLELELPFTLREPVLAVGGHIKNAVALAWKGRMVVSPHIGDLDHPRALTVFAEVIADLQRLYQVRSARVACDAHPRYASTRWARESGLPVMPVFHHRAHASALAAEHPDVEKWLCFTWDGTGFGEDGTLWGGEALLGRPGAWQRVASLRPFRLPGGEKAAREPWRSALALCWETGGDWPACPKDSSLLRQAWDHNLNTPSTSAAGRLFDAAAALLGANHHSSFEGQAPMWMEAMATADGDAIHLPLNLDRDGVLRSDWAPLLPALVDPHRSAGQRAAIFHASLARVIVDQAEKLHPTHGPFTIGLTGGVFQNRRLCETSIARLEQAGFAVRLHQQVPCNDGGLCAGQIVEAAVHDTG